MQKLKFVSILIFSIVNLVNYISGNPVNKILNDSNYSNLFVNEQQFIKLYQNSPENPINLDDQISYRLPNNSIPISYNITITTDVHKRISNFSGYSDIHVKILDSTDKITIHYRQINIYKVKLVNLDGSTILENTTFELIPSHDFLAISLPSTYDTGSELILQISYRGNLRRDLHGFYLGSYQTNENHTTFYAATQFQIDDARHAFPCYDEPGIRAVMAITIVHGKEYIALSNMEIMEQFPAADYFITKFHPTPPIQAYIVAFTICDFEYIEAVDSRIPQRMFAISSAIKNHQADFAASIVGPILDKFEKLLEVEFPLSKMDHTALTDFFPAGMENIGLINYLSSSILLNSELKGPSRISNQNYISSLVSHEVGHQWFGNIVSPKWWTYTWLNEGFATLFGAIVPSLLFPERNLMNDFVIEITPIAFKYDVLGSWSMNHYTENPRELSRKFNQISYKKAACVLRMFMDVLTEEVFLNGLKLYLEENYMQAVTADDLHRNLQIAYDHAYLENNFPVADVMSTWENQAGYPLVTVSIQDNTLKLNQRRYPESSGEIYKIPVSFATKSSPIFNSSAAKIWLNEESAVYPQSTLSFKENDWIIVNIQQIGYYRVDYDINLWHAIIKQLLNDHTVIHPLNRAVLQDEISIAWLDIGRVTAEDCIRILSYFGGEDNYIVWLKAEGTLDIFKNRLFGTAVHDDYLNMIKAITKPHLNRIGYDQIDGEDLDDAILRNIVLNLNCQALDRYCLARDYAKFDEFLNMNGSANFNFCNAFRTVDEDTFINLLRSTIADLGSRERTSILSNMGCSLSPENIDKLLASVLDGQNQLNIFERESILFNTFSKSLLGLVKTLDFVDKNYMELNNVLPHYYDLIRRIALYINGDPHLTIFMRILDNLVTENFITLENQQTVLATIISNNKWMDKNFDHVANWFASLKFT